MCARAIISLATTVADCGVCCCTLPCQLLPYCLLAFLRLVTQSTITPSVPMPTCLLAGVIACSHNEYNFFLLPAYDMVPACLLACQSVCWSVSVYNPDWHHNSCWFQVQSFHWGAQMDKTPHAGPLSTLRLGRCQGPQHWSEVLFQHCHR